MLNSNLQKRGVEGFSDQETTASRRQNGRRENERVHEPVDELITSFHLSLFNYSGMRGKAHNFNDYLAMTGDEIVGCVETHFNDDTEMDPFRAGTDFNVSKKDNCMGAELRCSIARISTLCKSRIQAILRKSKYAPY